MPKEERILPVVEETASLAKKRVESETIQARTITKTETVHLTTSLMTEMFDIEHVAVERWVEGPVPPRQEGDTLILSRLEEVPVVVRRLKVVEEIRVTRRAVTRPHDQDVTVRRQEVSVTRLPAGLMPNQEPSE